MRMNYQIKEFNVMSSWVSSDWSKSMMEISLIIHYCGIINGGEYSIKTCFKKDVTFIIMMTYIKLQSMFLLTLELHRNTGHDCLNPLYECNLQNNSNHHN